MSTLAVLLAVSGSPPRVTVNVAVSAASSEMLGVEVIAKLTFALSATSMRPIVKTLS